jgi:hypothetical protein
MKIMDQAGYRADTAAFFEANDFYEVEVARRIEVMGNMAHVWSLYEAYVEPGRATPERRGINSIQLYRDDTGTWRIVSMIWDNARPGVTVEPF